MYRRLVATTGLSPSLRSASLGRTCRSDASVGSAVWRIGTGVGCAVVVLAVGASVGVDVPPPPPPQAASNAASAGVSAHRALLICQVIGKLLVGGRASIGRGALVDV